MKPRLVSFILLWKVECTVISLRAREGRRRVAAERCCYSSSMLCCGDVLVTRTVLLCWARGRASWNVVLVCVERDWAAGGQRERNGSRSMTLRGSLFSLCVYVRCYLLFRLTFLSSSNFMFRLCSRAGELFSSGSRSNSRSSSSVGHPARGALQSVERAAERGAPAQVGGVETAGKARPSVAHL